MQVTFHTFDDDKVNLVPKATMDIEPFTTEEIVRRLNEKGGEPVLMSVSFMNPQIATVYAVDGSTRHPVFALMENGVAQALQKRTTAESAANA